MSDSAPSIMRAPPEQQTITSGQRTSMARSIARVIFSPTTTPMLPPMNAYSIAATIVGIPSTRPEPTINASLRPVAAIDEVSRSLYGFVSVNCSGSVETRSAIVLDPGSVIEERSQAIGRADPEVVGALGADAQVRGQVLVIDELRAAGTLGPQALGHAAGLGLRPWPPLACSSS